MTSESQKNTPLSDDSVEENMEDILNSIRQIMDMDHGTPLKPSKVFEGPSTQSVSDILNLSNPKIQQPPPSIDMKSPVVKPHSKKDGVLILNKSSGSDTKAAPTKKISSDTPNKKVARSPLSLHSMIENAMKPVIDQWLAENLERVLEDIVREEIKKMLNISKQNENT